MATSASLSRIIETSYYAPSERARRAYHDYYVQVLRKQNSDDPRELPGEEPGFWWCFVWDVADQARRTSAPEVIAWGIAATADFPDMAVAVPPEESTNA